MHVANSDIPLGLSNLIDKKYELMHRELCIFGLAWGNLFTIWFYNNKKINLASTFKLGDIRDYHPSDIHQFSTLRLLQLDFV